MDVINIRSVFTPRPGYVFVRTDYSQLEVRIVAHYSGEPKLIEALSHGGDIHSVVAKQVFKLDCDVKDVKKLYKPLRSAAKAIVFGLNYGITQYGLSKNLKISESEALDMINAFYATYPKLHAFMENTQKYVGYYNQVSTLLGRKRRFSEITPRALRQAMNFPIQSTAAEVTKNAMIEIDNNIKRYFNHSDVRMLMQIHDEILVECKFELVQDVVKMIKYSMELGLDKFGVKFAVPMIAEPSIDYAWGFSLEEAKEDEAEKLLNLRNAFDSMDVAIADSACKEYYLMYFRELRPRLSGTWKTIPGNVISTERAEGAIHFSQGEIDYLIDKFKNDPDYVVYCSKYFV